MPRLCIVLHNDRRLMSLNSRSNHHRLWDFHVPKFMHVPVKDAQYDSNVWNFQGTSFEGDISINCAFDILYLRASTSSPRNFIEATLLTKLAGRWNFTRPSGGACHVRGSFLNPFDFLRIPFNFKVCTGIQSSYTILHHLLLFFCLSKSRCVKQASAHPSLP